MSAKASCNDPSDSVKGCASRRFFSDAQIAHPLQHFSLIFRFFRKATIHLMRSATLIVLIVAASSYLAAAVESTSNIIPADASQHAGLPTLQLIKEMQTPGAAGEVSWSSDGSKLTALIYTPGTNLLPGIYIPSVFGGLIIVWNADGSVFQELRRPQPFFDVTDNFVFVAGNKQIVAPPSEASNDLAFSIFDVESAKIVREVAGAYPGRARNVNAAIRFAASPDQSILAVAFGSALIQPVALYSSRDWSKIADLPKDPIIPLGPSALAFSADGRTLAVALVSTVLIYDLNSRQITQTIKPFPGLFGSVEIAFSSREDVVAFATHTLPKNNPLPNGGFETVLPKDPVRLFSIKDASRIATYSGSFKSVRSLTMSPDGRLVAFITNYETLHIWDPFQPGMHEETIELGRGSSGADSLSFSPDGRKLAVGGGRSVKIFSVTQ